MIPSILRPGRQARCEKCHNPIYIALHEDHQTYIASLKEDAYIGICQRLTQEEVCRLRMLCDTCDEDKEFTDRLISNWLLDSERRIW